MHTIASLCATAFTQKPSSEVVETHIHHNLKAFKLRLDELITHIEEGKSFTCAVFERNKRDAVHFLSTQLFGVDFDKNVTLQQATDRLHDFGLDYTFGYYTFRHTDAAPRFRLMFLMDGEVRDTKLASDILKLLYKFFDEKNDGSCLDAARLWHGTNKRSFKGGAGSIDLMEFIDRLNFRVYQNDRNQLRRCLPITNVNKQWRNGQPYYSYNSDVHISPDSLEPAPEEVRHWNREELQARCRVFREFVSGTKLPHNVLKGIASNLYLLRGGEKLFRETIKNSKDYDRDKVDIISWCKSNEVFPKKIKEFSPYGEDASFDRSLVDLTRKKGAVEMLTIPDLISVEEAQQQLHFELQRIVNENVPGVYLIRSAPGTGKTSFINELDGCVKAFPNHQLKEEQFRASSRPNKVTTPKLLSYFSEALGDRFNAYYASDLAKNVNIEIKSLLQGLPVNDATPEEYEGAKAYDQALTNVEFADPDTSIYTTHTKAVYQSFKQDVIIFDESPLNSFLEQHTALVDELLMLMGRLMIKGVDVSLLRAILEAPEHEEYKDTPRMNYDPKTIYSVCAEARFKSHVYRFFQSASFCLYNGRVNYTLNNLGRLPKDKVVIILDATASTEIYKGLFGDCLKVVDIANVKNIGLILQHTTRSCSKEGLYEYAQELTLNDAPTLTFKEFASEFENGVEDCCFFSGAGTNRFEGRDINVVGTPNVHPNYYRAITHNLKMSGVDFTMKNQSVTYEGRRFTYYTYSDPFLQKLHLQTIEGHLLQLVHRSRLIRCKATVTLHSGFPLQQAKYVFL